MCPSGLRGTRGHGLASYGYLEITHGDAPHPCILLHNSLCEVVLMCCPKRCVSYIKYCRDGWLTRLTAARRVPQTLGWRCSSIPTSCRARTSDSKARPGEHLRDCMCSAALLPPSSLPRVVPRRCAMQRAIRCHGCFSEGLLALAVSQYRTPSTQRRDSRGSPSIEHDAIGVQLCGAGSVYPSTYLASKRTHHKHPLRYHDKITRNSMSSPPSLALSLIMTPDYTSALRAQVHGAGGAEGVQCIYPDHLSDPHP